MPLQLQRQLQRQQQANCQQQHKQQQQQLQQQQQQQLYGVQQQGYGNYPGFVQPDQRYGAFLQGPWSGEGTVLSATGLGTPGSAGQQQQQLQPSQAAQQLPQQPQQQPLPQLPCMHLLLEPPPALERRDPQAVVRMLQGAPISRRPNTFRVRNGPGLLLAQEWCAMLRQAAEAHQEHGGEDSHHAHTAATWDVGWGMWGATAGVQMDGTVHGDGYGGGGSMIGPMVNPVMLGMHGDPSLYASASAVG